MTSVKKDLFKKVFHFFSSLFRFRDLFWILFTDIRRSPHFSLRREKEVKKKKVEVVVVKKYTQSICVFQLILGPGEGIFIMTFTLDTKPRDRVVWGPKGTCVIGPKLRGLGTVNFFFFHLVFESKGLIFYNCLFSRIRMPNFKR